MNGTSENSKSIIVGNASPQEVAEFIREVNGKEIRKFKVVYDDGRIEQKRLFANDNRIGYLAPRKKKSGYLFDLQGVYAISYDLSREVDRNAQFERNAKRLMEILEKSGLWANIRKQIQELLEFGYENYRKQDCPSRIFSPDLAYNILHWNVKKMDFRPRYADREEAARCNEITQSAIANAMSGPENEYHTRVEGRSYDISFSYNAGQIGKPMWKAYPNGTQGDGIRRAWYSEEYRGCGNGHYYLAINATHAIYYEKD